MRNENVKYVNWGVEGGGQGERDPEWMLTILKRIIVEDSN